MDKKIYKIYDVRDRVINCLTKKEVKLFLYKISGNDINILKKIEIYDPYIGWKWSDNWLKLNSKEKSNSMENSN